MTINKEINVTDDVILTKHGGESYEVGDSQSENVDMKEDEERVSEIVDVSLNSSSQTTLDLSSQELNEFPLQLFRLSECIVTKITCLCLDYNNLDQLPGDVQLFINLTEMSMNGNDLTELPQEFCALKKLETLSLNENALVVLPKDLGKLISLKKLSVVGNELVSLPDSFSLLTNLQEVYVDENKLSALPAYCSGFKQLCVLEVSNNMLEYLPKDIGDVFQLRIFNLNNNKLERLPESFCRLENLEILDLSNNVLKELPSHQFACVKRLRKLYLENNNIKVLPCWFSNIPELEELLLSDNTLCKQQFTDDFCSNSTKLRILEAGANFMESLSPKFGLLKNLESIHFGSTILELERSHFQNGNWMTELPESLTELTKLSKANLNENQIAFLPYAFGNLCSLTWLDLGQNMLHTLPSSFCELVNMQFLQLSKNQLEELPEDIGNLQKLIELRLNHNLLTNIPASLGRIKGLQSLDLFHNQLEEIPNVVFYLKKLNRLDLDENNFHVSLSQIPRIVSGLHYPKRDPSLKNNWRGKSRVEEYNDDVIEHLVPEEESVSNGDDEEEVHKQTLKMAINRGMSFWRSHDNTNEKRGVDNAMRTKSCDVDDDDWVPLTSTTTNHMSSDIKDPCEEDWDEEIANNEIYKKVLLTYEERKDKYSNIIDAFQCSINKYPPAVQAYSMTANYESFVYKQGNVSCVLPSISTVDNETVQGQFDDAES